MIIKMGIALLIGLGFTLIGMFMENKLKIKDIRIYSWIFFVYGVICGLLMLKFICL